MCVCSCKALSLPSMNCTEVFLGLVVVQCTEVFLGLVVVQCTEVFLGLVVVQCTEVILGLVVVQCTEVFLGLVVVQCTEVFLGLVVVQCTEVFLGLVVVQCTEVFLGLVVVHSLGVGMMAGRQRVYPPPVLQELEEEEQALEEHRVVMDTPPDLDTVPGVLTAPTKPKPVSLSSSLSPSLFLPLSFPPSLSLPLSVCLSPPHPPAIFPLPPFLPPSVSSLFLYVTDWDSVDMEVKAAEHPALSDSPLKTWNTSEYNIVCFACRWQICPSPTCRYFL